MKAFGVDTDASGLFGELARLRMADVMQNQELTKVEISSWQSPAKECLPAILLFGRLRADRCLDSLLPVVRTVISKGSGALVIKVTGAALQTQHSGLHEVVCTALEHRIAKGVLLEARATQALLLLDRPRAARLFQELPALELDVIANASHLERLWALWHAQVASWPLPPTLDIGSVAWPTPDEGSLALWGLAKSLDHQDLEAAGPEVELTSGLVWTGGPVVMMCCLFAIAAMPGSQLLPNLCLERAILRLDRLHTGTKYSRMSRTKEHQEALRHLVQITVSRFEERQWDEAADQLRERIEGIV
jgi:hypothetical protein